jgi:hypothetical protein
MFWIHSLLLAAHFFLPRIAAIELYEIGHPIQHDGILSKWLWKRKVDYTGCDLKSSEVFLWQGNVEQTNIWTLLICHRIKPEESKAERSNNTRKLYRIYARRI